jgi:hypothetical protein
MTFEHALARGALEEAVDAYAGDLLEGNYDVWVVPERERLKALYVDALETEGNPLFVVETLRAGAASPRLQSVIEARLARLSAAARDIATLAAAIGREFTADVLGRATGLSDDALVGPLDELWRRRIVRDRAPDGYDFTHDRIREVAYRSLGPAERRRAHLRIARALADGAADAAIVAAQRLGDGRRGDPSRSRRDRRRPARGGVRHQSAGGLAAVRPEPRAPCAVVSGRLGGAARAQLRRVREFHLRRGRRRRRRRLR